ncbi:hypothetical protein K439DRAFT_1341990 [Ramaria rubella]|nr:hypothetical protein K439DRAFT_1341990 [Ramaria rubella]
MQLAASAEAGHAARAFRICAAMKKAGIKPDIISYGWLMQACAKQALASECLALLDDMAFLHLQPDVEIYNHVLFSQRFIRNFSLEDLFNRMEKDQVMPNTHTYHHVVLRYVEANNLEMCLQCFGEMNGRGVSPMLQTAQVVIELATYLGHPRIALDIAYAFEAASARKLEAPDWVSILAASTACHFETGVLEGWHKAVDDLGVVLDEGQCIEVLHTASRLGLTDLAMRALQMIIGMQVPLEEFHLAPVLEAFVKRGMVEEAFSIVNLMRSSEVQFTQNTASPILSCVGNIDQVDEAWSVLENMHKQGKPVDVVSLNIIIQAAAQLNDLQRAIGTYKSFADFDVKPTIYTFNFLLIGCVAAQHRELGDKLLTELRELGLVPDSQTFENIIMLCLTQASYEDAFFYLEEMKAQGYLPPLSVYTALVKKCLTHNDFRWKIALEELTESGYPISPTLQNYIDFSSTRNQPSAFPRDGEEVRKAKRNERSSQLYNEFGAQTQTNDPSVDGYAYDVEHHSEAQHVERTYSQ